MPKKDSSFIDHFDGFWAGVHYVHWEGKLFRVTRGGRRWKEVLPKKKRGKRWRTKNRLRHVKHYRVLTGTPRFREGQIAELRFHKPVIAAVTVMGKYKTFSNNSLTSSVSIKATGSGNSSAGWRRTWDRLNPGPPYLAGGAFKKIEYHLEQGSRKGYGTYTSDGNPNLIGTGLRFVYEGDFRSDSNWGVGNSTDFTQSDFTDFSPLSEYHSLAWDKCKPTISKAGLTQFLVELRELPTMLATTANFFHNSWRSFGGGYSSVVMHPSSVADNFLNYNFGWVPFINDLSSLYDTWVNSHKYIAQTVRDNGRWLKRKRVLEVSESNIRANRFYHSGTDPSSGSFQMEPLLRDMTLDGSTCKAYCDIYDETLSSVWAAGSFKYYRPEFDDNLADFSSSFTTVQRLLALYGARVNPSVLWKVTPWTWAIDWFAGVGKFIEHHDEFVDDGIVSQYLYCMKHTERRIVKNSYFNWFSGPRLLTWFRRIAYKQREVADSPYGFNRPWQTLSAKQWAILGSIGFTRLNGGFIAHGS